MWLLPRTCLVRNEPQIEQTTRQHCCCNETFLDVSRRATRNTHNPKPLTVASAAAASPFPTARPTPGPTIPILMALPGAATTAAAAVAWLDNRSAAAPPLLSTVTEEDAGRAMTPVAGAPKLLAPALCRKLVPPRAGEIFRWGYAKTKEWRGGARDTA